MARTATLFTLVGIITPPAIDLWVSAPFPVMKRTLAPGLNKKGDTSSNI